ncbi:MAG TPA: RES family NAD+ phosphorylase [Gammaproteobacteria bacterium]|nr:RES family NAD+ phosphorylase [Gammaproteobacteria bacterium]
MARLTEAAVRRVVWQHAVRIIPSRFPPVGPFDSVAAPEDLAAVYAVEAATNPRVLQDWGRLDLVPEADRIAGPGTTPIMAAFTHPNPDGSRFSDGSFGVYYSAREEPTAIAESTYHRERILRWSRAPAMKVEMRQYAGGVSARLVDLRGGQREWPECYRRDDYSGSQRFGMAQKAADRSGIVYDSVRCNGGVCAAVFKPRALRPVVQSKHYYFVWDGERITDVLNVSRV